jgi:hypothetical protein
MSILALKDQLYVDLMIDETDFPTMTNFMDEICIIENIGSLVPTFSMIVNDSEDVFMDALSLTDGNLFSVVLGRDISEVSGDNANQSKNFRLFSHKAKRYQTGYKYAISGIFDAPKFTVETRQMEFEGTTDSVLKKLAEMAGIDYTGTTTQDNQVWLNVSDPCSVFARKLAQHSYLPEGLMLLCLASDNTLIYKNVLDLLNQTPTNFFSSTETDTSRANGAHVLSDWELGSTAGFMNHWLNYGYLLVEPTLEGVNSTYNGITLSTAGNFVAINSDVSSAVEQARTDYTPIDCGNTHPRYWQAFHANLRRMGMFTQKLICIVNDVTNINPMETIDVTIYNAATGRPSPVSGVYLVTAKKTLIKSTRYAEIFELTRPSVPNAGKSKLMG